MPSLEFNRFYESCFGKHFAQPGEKLDVEALLSLQNEEREQAEQLLLGVIETTEEYEPIEAIGYLNACTAIDPLRRRLISDIDNDKPWNRIAAALALFRIERYYTASILVDVLHNSDPIKYSWSREAAAMKLSHFGKTKMVVQSLLNALNDQDTMLAHSARVSLWLLFRPNDKIEELLQRIDDKLVSRDDSISHHIEELSSLITIELSYMEGTYCEQL